MRNRSLSLASISVKRSTIYSLTAGVGFVAGAVVGIAGRNCSHAAQPPLFECITEDPQDTLIPAFALGLLAVAIVAGLDLTRSALKMGSDARVPAWRRWLYVVLLAVVAFPAARIAVEQISGGYSDSDLLAISIIGTWALTPIILVEFTIWLFRRRDGLSRLIPVAALIAIGTMTYLATSDPDLACIRHSTDNTSCLGGMQIYITDFVLLCVMVSALFLPWKDEDRMVQSDDSTEAIHT